jgi:hypothetical protein
MYLDLLRQASPGTERIKVRGFGLVVRAVVWHAGDLGSILGRDGLYTFGCIPPAPWALLCGYVHYTKVLISFFFKVKCLRQLAEIRSFMAWGAGDDDKCGVAVVGRTVRGCVGDQFHFGPVDGQDVIGPSPSMAVSLHNKILLPK